MFNSKSYFKTLNLIEIKKEALLRNFQYLSSLQKNGKVCPVLKSNAYGHGLKLIAEFVDKELRPEFICVDSLYEAYELKKIDISTNVLVLGYTFPENFKFKKINFHLPLFEIETLKILNKYQPGVNVHIKIDSGMNRLGLKEDNIEKFVKELKKYNKINVAGIYTHLASADDPNDTKFSKDQIKKFKEIVLYFENNGFNFQYKHVNATSGLFRFNDPDFNIARVGIGLFGISPFPKHTKLNKQFEDNLKPVLKLKTHLVDIKELNKDEGVSYGRTFIAPKKMKIGILPIGYYDGIDRGFSNNGFVKIRNKYCKIIGRVCMNITVVDVSNIENLKDNEEVIIYDDVTNSRNSIYNLSSLINTIPYEILSRLSSTTRRILV